MKLKNVGGERIFALMKAVVELALQEISDEYAKFLGLLKRSEW